MKYRLAFAGLATAGALTLTGCGSVTISTSPPSPSAPAPAASAPASAGASGASGAAKPKTSASAPSSRKPGQLPDPCQVLTRADAQRLSGKTITQVDKDAGYCQYQLSGGQLALFLATTTPAEFASEAGHPEAKPVMGVGEKAYSLAGHLYVLHEGFKLDVYARVGTDAANLNLEKQTAAHAISKL